jgi:menaquinone-specific isochorismate synthase
MKFTLSEFDQALTTLLLRQGVLFGMSKEGVFVGWGDLKALREAPEKATSFYCPDFFLESPGAWVLPKEVAYVSRSSLIEALEGVSELSPAVDPVEWKSPEWHSFRRRFMQVQREIKAGRWQKAVPICFETATQPVMPAHIVQMLLGVLRSDAPLMPYALWDSTGGIAGASPELLCTIDSEGTVRSTALAGTVGISVDPKQLLADPKERHEHQLVVDYLKERLSTLGVPHTDAPKVLRLPHLQHLITEVAVVLTRPVTLLELARLLHPSPALGVSPRHLGWEWLRDLDREFPRGRFGAPFGIQFADGSAACCVAIRNVQWGPDRFILGSGCGVVAASELEREWEELALKRDSVHRLLGV